MDRGQGDRRTEGQKDRRTGGQEDTTCWTIRWLTCITIDVHVLHPAVIMFQGIFTQTSKMFLSTNYYLLFMIKQIYNAYYTRGQEIFLEVY